MISDLYIHVIATISICGFDITVIYLLWYFYAIAKVIFNFVYFVFSFCCVVEVYGLEREREFVTIVALKAKLVLNYLQNYHMFRINILQISWYLVSWLLAVPVYCDTSRMNQTQKYFCRILSLSKLMLMLKRHAHNYEKTSFCFCLQKVSQFDL